METPQHRVDGAVDRVFQGLDEPLDTIRGFIAKTDVDFIQDGNFNPALKKENQAAISEAIDNYREAVAANTPYAVADEEHLSAVDQAAVAYVAENNLTIPSWNHRAVGSGYERPLPELPESVEDLRPLFHEVADKTQEATEWWENDAPYFSIIHNGNHGTVGKVSMFPARGVENVRVLQNKHSYEIDARSDVVAEFRDGVTATVNEAEGKILKIAVDSKDVEHGLALLGHHNIDRQVGRPDNFRTDARYSKFSFISNEGFDQPSPITNTNRYAARIALQTLASTRGEAAPELPLPDESYAQKVLGFLASSTIAAFLPRHLAADVHHGGGTMTGYAVEGVTLHEKFNQVESVTERQLNILLGAAGLSIADLSEMTTVFLDRRYNSPLLADRINAIKARPGVETFLDSLNS